MTSLNRSSFTCTCSFQISRPSSR